MQRSHAMRRDVHRRLGAVTGQLSPSILPGDLTAIAVRARKRLGRLTFDVSRRLSTPSVYNDAERLQP